jgi:hypothetical protein
MSLAPSERRALARIENSLSSSDPGLATMLATFTLPTFDGGTPRWKCLLRRIVRIPIPFILAGLVLAAMSAIIVGALLRSGPGDPLCTPSTRAIAGGQTLSCPPAAGPLARPGRPAGNDGIGKPPASADASGR